MLTETDADERDARIGLLRRYLRCYGPSTPEHFAAWGGTDPALAAMIPRRRLRADDTGDLMSQTDRTAVESSLERRVTELERAADQGRFARLYGPIAVTLVALSALPPFQDIGDGAVTVSFGTLWDMARTNAGDPAVFGLFLLGILVALLVVASFGVAGTGTLAGIVVTSGLIILMLLTKPGTGEPPPELSGVGVVGLILVICTAALATVHAIQLVRRRP